MKNIKLNAITCTREEAAHKIADHLHHAEPFAIWFTAGVGRSYDADGNIICAYEAPAPADAIVLDLDELEAQPEATSTNFELKYVPFPKEIQGIITGFLDGAELVPVIVIDSSQDEQTQQQALRHELSHLILNHLYDPEADIKTIEAEADEEASRMTEADIEALLAWKI